MALADDTRVAGPAGYEGGQYDRTPPQDVPAEQSALGGMLLSKDAIADVVEVLRPTDFYRPAHQLIYDAILDLYARGEPADAVTVSAELTRAGQLARVGGAPYLHTLISTVPTAANAGYYAQIVSEKAVLRRLVTAGTRIVQMGYDTATGQSGIVGSVDDVVDRAQAEIYDVTERRTSEDYVHIESLLTGTLTEIERIADSGGIGTGIPTGFARLDEITNGLHPGQMITVAGRPGSGKALALGTPLPTPSGWTTMREVQVGDLLLGADGRPTRVVAATGVMRGRPCYEVEFSDGTTIVADAEHQWRTTSRASVLAAARGAPTVGAGASAGTAGARRGSAEIVTTEQIAHTVRCGTVSNHSVACTAPLALPPSRLPLPPYVLGAWLGRRRHHGVRGALRVRLQAMGVLGRRHIPAQYLRASEAQRRALLAGILDGGGTMTPSGNVTVTASRCLAEGIRELVASLGYRPVLRSDGCTVAFTPGDHVFRLRHVERHAGPASRRAHSRQIVAVRPMASVPVRCVQVDNAEHLYLAGRGMVPTHNSTLALDFARSAAVKHGKPTVVFSLEMGKLELMMRLFSAEALVPLRSMRSGHMSDQDWARLARRSGELAEAPLFLDDSPNLTMMEIRAKARRLRQRQDLQLIIIDYLQLMTSGKRVESRQQEVSEFSRAIKLLAKELDVPVIALSQLNRGPEQRTDKKPMLADLRESGCLTADTTLLRADTGAPITFRQLLDDGHEGTLVWSFDEQRSLVPAPITNVFPAGVKPVFRLRLASGREVKATGNHPFLTFGGWASLDSLTPGDRIAIPRRIPEPIGAGLGWSAHRLGLLAHLIGDGCVLRSQPVHYTSDDEANLEFVESAAADEFGITPRRVQHGRWWHSYLPAPYRCARGRYNPLHVWFRELGIEDLRSHEKRLPDALHAASTAEVAVFLRHLWATDGCVAVPRPGSTSARQAYYATSSRALADGVMMLLARFGIVARLEKVTQGQHRPNYHAVIADGPSMRTFCREIGVHGRRIADALGSQPLRVAASDDVFWDRIVEIEPLGDQPVYDATVKGTHNFIADGIAAHNSIEQDSDVVLLVHREDMYERESPRAGEADLIIAKHRNGPTATVAVSFQGHYSRFSDMPE